LINYLANMKKLITLSLFCLFAISLSSQTAEDDYYTGTKPKLLSKDRVSASISAGAGVSFLNSSKNTAYSTFIAPRISYLVTNRFKLNIGLMHYTVTGNMFTPASQNESLLNNRNKNISGNMIFVEGQYLLNKRTVLSGAVMVDANNYSKQNTNFKAATLGLDYKVSKHSSIGIRATVSQGTGDYFNPSTRSFDYNPFTQNPWGNNAPRGQMSGDALFPSFR
jgi:hypothetical protein